MKRNLYIFLGMALIALPASAQQQAQPNDTTLNRTVVVEQEYNPIITDASKVNVLPKVEEPVVNKKEVEYAITSTPASDIPASTMQAYTGKETQPVTPPGYIRLGYGNYNNLDAYANYLFRLSSKDKLNVNFNMRGMNGELDMPSYDNYNINKWDAFYYRTRASIDYLHQFNRIDLDIAGHFGLSNFNHTPYSVFNKQKFTSGDAHVGLKSTDETLPLQFRAETNLMLYNREQVSFYSNQSVTETLVRTKANVTGAINDEQLVGISAEMNNLLYDPRQLGEYNLMLLLNRTTVNLNPYYELSNDSWRLHVGANVDLSFKNGKGFYASPDIDLAYIFSDSYMLYAKATGGRLLNDFRRLEQENPYAGLDVPIADTYQQVDARIGVKGSPATGLWFNLFGGYQNFKNDLYPIAGYLSGGEGGSEFTDYGQTDSYNFQGGVQISQAYKDVFSFSIDATYYHWNASDDAIINPGANSYNEALLMKPKFKLGLQIEARPIPALLLNLGYQYIYRAEPYSSDERYPAINNLSLGVSYYLFKGVSIYAKADNLLNKEYEYYLNYPTQGINFVGGLSFRF